ncbi:MAG TPA: tetratricopeptide repeat protein [bacterium]|nr:tetratricopeptide repeat protein [bacterium]
MLSNEGKARRLALCGALVAALAFSSLAAGQDAAPKQGIKLPTLTITGQAKYLIMPEQPPVVREKLALVDAGEALLPRIHELRTYPTIDLEPALLAPRSGGCLFGWALGASVSMIFAKEESLFRYALVLYSKGKFSESDARLKRLLQEYPRSQYAPESLFFRGQIALAQVKYNAASKSFESFLDRFPRQVLRHDALCNLAYARFKVGNIPGTVSALSELLDGFPNSAKTTEAMYARAALQFTRGDFVAAADDFRRLAELASNDGLRNEYTLWRLESLYSAGKYEDALSLSAASAESFQDSEMAPRFDYVRALALKSAGRADEAADLFERIAGLFGDRNVAAGALFAKAQIDRERGLLRQAEDGFTRLITRYPSSPYYCPALVNLASVRLTASDFERAKEALMTAVSGCKVDRDFMSRVSYYMGLVFASENKPNEAVKHFKSARDKAGDDEVRAAAFLGCGWASFATGRYKQAASLFNEALSLKPSGGAKLESLFWAGQAQLQLGQAKLAEGSFQQLISSANVGPGLLLDAHLGLGFAAFLQERWEYALKHFEIVARSDRPDDDRALSWLRMAQCAMHLGQYESGVKYSERATERTDLEPVLCGAGFIKGECLLRLGQKKEAFSLLESLSDRFPGCDYLDEAKYAVASAHFEDSEFEKSIAAFRGILKDFPRSPLVPKALLGIANSSYNMGDYKMAEASYGKTLDSGAGPADQKSALYGLVLCLQRQGLLSQVERRIEEFIERFKDRRTAGALRSLLAEELAQRKQSFGAIRQYNKAFESLTKAGAGEDELAKILYRIGQIMEAAGDKEGAISEYDQLVFRFKGNRLVQMARLRKAHLYADLKQTKKAIEIYSKLAQEYPKAPEVAGVALLKHALLVKKTNPDESLRLCDDVAARFGHADVAAEALIVAAEVLIDRKRFGTARERLAKATELGVPADKKAYHAYLLGYSFFLQDNFKRAASALMRVRYLYPDSKWAAESLLLAGKSLLKLEQPGEARKVFAAVIRDYPQATEAVRKAEAALKSLPSSD